MCIITITVPLSSNLTVMVMPMSACSHLALHSLHLGGVPVQLPPNDGGKQEPCTLPLYEELWMKEYHTREHYQQRSCTEVANKVCMSLRESSALGSTSIYSLSAKLHNVTLLFTFSVSCVTEHTHQ